MMRVIAAFIICLLLTGCWDQTQLKKLLFVDVVGLDYAGDSKQIQLNYVISSLREASQGGGKPSGLFVQSIGGTLYDAVNNTNKEMPGVLNTLETRLYLISNRFAKDDPLSYLNSTAQFISNPLYAYLAVYDGDLPKLLAKKKVKNLTVADFLVGILDEEKKRGRIPTNKLLHLILGGTEFLNDFALNRFEPYGEEARLAGTALFSDGKYTGVNLDNEETQLAYLLEGAKGRNQFFFSQAEDKKFSALLLNAKRKFHILSTSESVREIIISLKLDLKLVEDGNGSKNYTKKIMNDLEKTITADLTVKSAKVIATLQKANCDYLQLGHEVAAYHPNLYKAMNWREQYPKLKIKPIVKVRILNTGIVE
ncbi:Ger(x)C family spore germination protein [Paenibacillus montanisoli]|uniref:Ger(X)C family spore germination protein n=1 Tax=Paenibacillus montanisoli TaxID=2081970 RepID=A0A328U711_9BACL|nr:Ger(x)C family spore germination protein [Paenibacillus montanisoli]RAP75874.1 Ger(x)C family spore germination protein [Paenibacillus montanisoli]